MHKWIRFCFVLGMLAGCSTAAWAEGWKMPDLNPFDNNAAAPPSEGTSKSWLPSWKKNNHQAGPSVWKKVQETPGNIANGTKRAVNAVNPFKGASQPSPRPITGSNLDKPQPSKRWLGGWGDEETSNRQPPQTASDFIGGRRPE